MSAPVETYPTDIAGAVIDRQSVAARIIAFIINAKSRVVILHGKHGSGKTDLLMRLVLPGLQAAVEADSCDVLYGDCVPDLPSILAAPRGHRSLADAVLSKTIIVIDDFERIFTLTRDQRREALDRLFGQLQRKDTQAVVVLVTDTRQLTSVYALSSYEPDITKAVLEVPSVGIVEGLKQLSQIDPETAASYSEEAVQALSLEATQLEERGWDITFGLIKLVDARLRRFRHESGTALVNADHVKALGGLQGILETHMRDGLEQLDAECPGGRELGLAILERIYDSGARGATTDFDDMPARLGVSPDELDAVIARMTEAVTLLQKVGTDEYELIPPQLGAVLKQHSVSMALETERFRRIVGQGLTSWQLLGNLLPPERFEEVHRARAWLVLASAEIRFLLHCALRHPDCTVAEYWLRRISDRVDAIDILLSCLFDPAGQVRVQAAALLRKFPEPEVRERLHVLAINDPEPGVRAQAIASLEAMRDDALMELLIQEAENPKSPHRAEAVEALRIFPNQRVAGLLQALVNDPTSDRALREKAIRVLSLLSLPESVDALLDIGLRDPDEEDRQAAAVALGAIESEDLNRRLLSRLRVPTQVTRARLSRVAICLIALLGVGVFHFLLVLVSVALAESTAPALAALPLLLTILLPIPTGLLLARLRAGRIKKASPQGMLAAALFALCVISVFFWVHGLAHLLIGRWRRGFTLFGLEVFGLALAFWSYVFAQAHPALGWVYIAVGVSLFIWSYLYDFIVVSGESLLLTEQAVLESRYSAIFRHIFSNPPAAGLVYETLQSPEPDAARWAGDIFGQFGECAQPDQLIALLKSPDQPRQAFVLQALKKSKGEETVRKLEELWQVADGALRKRIATILYRKPSQRSLQALDRVRGEMPLGLKLRSSLARWNFRVAVWPWPARAAVLLVLLTGSVFIYHGIMSVRSPAWSLMMRLKPPLDRFVSDDQKIAILNFLTDQYPLESTVHELQQVFHKNAKPPWDDLRAALTHSLLKLHHDDLFPAQATLHQDLLKAAQGFAGLLSEDSVAFERGLGVLRAMADAPDSVLADTATGLLVLFALRESTDAREARTLQAIDAVGAIRYDRALPALDSLLRVPQERLVGDRIRENVKRITAQKYAAGEGKDLAGVLSKLQASRPLVSGLSHELSEALSQVNLQVIEGDPSSEDGYRDLLNQNVRDSQFTRAQEVFVRLKEQHADRLWPRKILAELYHEYLALRDTAYFLQSYQEMANLRRLPAYHTLRAQDTTNYYRFEADFVEVLLSARRYPETEKVAQEVLALTDQHVYRLNMALFAYMAQVMSGDRGRAAAKLKQLEEVTGTLPQDFYNGWIYPGTKQFIASSNLPAPLRDALLKLCQEGDWYSPKEAAQVLAANRSALTKLEPANAISAAPPGD